MSKSSKLPNWSGASLIWRRQMSLRGLRNRIDRLAAALHKRSRMPELIAKFKTGDMTVAEEKEALSLDRRWPAIKASIVAEWDRQYRSKRDARKPRNSVPCPKSVL